MDIEIRKTHPYRQVTVSEDRTTIDLGLLTDIEQSNLATKLREAASELDPQADLVPLPDPERLSGLILSWLQQQPESIRNIDLLILSERIISLLRKGGGQ